MKQLVFKYAIQVFGSEEVATRWLNQDNDSFDGKKPISLLNTSKECEKILNILSIIETNNQDQNQIN